MSDAPSPDRAGGGASSLRRFRPGFWFGGFNGLTWMVGLGTPMVLLAEQLGASPSQVGLASSFVFLLLPVQVLATVTLRRLGYRGQMVVAWLLRALFLLIPFSLAWSAPGSPQPWMVHALVASVFGFCLFRAFGTAAHLPWFAAILPDHLRGRYFATDSAITSAVGVLTLLGSAWLFGWLPAYDAFRVLYGVAITGSLLAVVNLLRLPAAQPSAHTPLQSIVSEARSLCLTPGRFRHYLLLCLLGSIVASSLGAFTVYYLKAEAGLPASRIMLFSAAQFAGQIAGTWSIRHWIDRVPIRRFLQLATLAVGAFELFWLAYVGGADGLERLLPVAYLLFGAAAGTSNTAHFTYLPELSEEHRRPVSIAVFTAILGLWSGLGPVLWGLALEGGGSEPGVLVERFVLFFGVGAAISALLAWLYGRLPDPRASVVAG